MDTDRTNKIATKVMSKTLRARKDYYIEIEVHEQLSFSTEDDILDIVKKEVHDAESSGINDRGNSFTMTVRSNDLEGMQEAVSTLSRWYSVSKVMDY